VSRKLHIGGTQPSPGWEILNAVPSPWVDHLGDARDLSPFPDNTFSDVYASHVLEHMDYIRELTDALTEWRRVLQPGGRLYISVPDLDVLARLFLDRENLTVDDRFQVMRMMFGAHVDKYDYHVAGLNQEFLTGFLSHTGYTNMRRVERFGLFQDTSTMVFKGVAISINIIAEKPLT
jgi:predicted SAM-dependent methyltransferase